MRYMHTPAGFEYYWIVIPVVGLLVVLFNAHRMGKFRSISLRGKLTGAALLVLVAILALFLLKQRVLDSYLVPADGLSAYSDLEEAFLEQESGILGGQIVAVEVGNLLWSHEIYLLPCYEAVIRDVPQNGQTRWYTEVWVLGDGEGRTSIRNLELKMDFGEETMLSSRVELNGDEDLYDMGTDREVVLEQEISLNDGDRFRIGALASTAASVQTENMETEGSFLWNYDLYYDGTKVAEIRNVILSGTYLINAT